MSLWRSLLLVVLALVCYFAVQECVSFFIVRILALYVGIGGKPPAQMTGGYTLTVSLIANGLTIPALYVLFYDRSTYRAPVRLSLLWNVLFGCCLCVSLNMLISVFRLSELFPTYTEVSEHFFVGSLWLELLTIGVISPFLEELLFRGIMYKEFRSCAGPRLAMLLSALIFGAMHMNMLQFLYASVLGLCLAWVYERYQSLWAPYLVHAAANIFSVVITENETVQRFLSSGFGAVFTIVLLTGALWAPVFIVRSTRKEL